MYTDLCDKNLHSSVGWVTEGSKAQKHACIFPYINSIHSQLAQLQLTVFCINFPRNRLAKIDCT